MIEESKSFVKYSRRGRVAAEMSSKCFCLVVPCIRFAQSLEASVSVSVLASEYGVIHDIA